MKNKLLPFVFLTLIMTGAGAQDRTINLMISEHHADHLGFFFRYGERYNVPYGRARPSATLVVLDAHADTVKNERAGFIRQFAAARYFGLTVDNAGNHNWIQPLAPVPMVELAWINTLHGHPRADKLQGFETSVASWGRRVNAYALSLEELGNREVPERTLFISVDLDFFYSDYHLPRDVPAVLDALFDFSSRSQHPVVWAFCLSRSSLPSDDYAWALLEQTLRWLNSHPEFCAPEVTLFEGHIFDTSHTAQAFRAEGKEMPFLREIDAPDEIKMLLWELQMRDWD
jgi:hypothetical protein